MIKNIREGIAIGASPKGNLENIKVEENLKEIYQQGFRTIIDLCTEKEDSLLDEKSVTDLGFKYINIPVSAQNLNLDTLNHFQEVLEKASPPVYVCCASGLRAGVMTLLTIAPEENWTFTKYQEELNKLGLQHKPNCPLKDFAQDYFSQK